MALDKQFLKYKLEKIKNDRIFKDQDTETKRRIRRENSKLAQEEADAIHSYLTGDDPIDSLDNKSYLENKLPGNLFLDKNGQLDIVEVQLDPKIKKKSLSRMLRKHKTISNANVEFGKGLLKFKKILNKIGIVFSLRGIKIDGEIQSNEYKSKDGSVGLSEDFLISDVTVDDGGNEIFIRKRIIVKNGLIVDQEIINN